jgi:hypothetical protein
MIELRKEKCKKIFAHLYNKNLALIGNEIPSKFNLQKMAYFPKNARQPKVSGHYVKC